MTSNPTIFQGAIAEGDAYDDQIRELSAELDDPKEIFWQLAKDDIRDACDILRPVWDEGEGKDGWVSLEVDPNLAHDTETTKSEAIRLHGLVDRPNLFIKIPATVEGLQAIEDTIAAGIPVNVTLIFSLERHRKVAEAYVRGVQRFVDGGGDPTGKLASVASFFVSRVDTEADKRLDEIGGHDELKGKLAIANAKLAYQTYREVFMDAGVGGAGGQGRDQAALPVGVDRRQEPGLQGHGLRRGARRARHRQHDAARARRGGRSTTARSAATRCSRTSTRRARVLDAFEAAGVNYDDVVADARARGRGEVRQVLRGPDRGPRVQAQAGGGVAWRTTPTSGASSASSCGWTRSARRPPPAPATRPPRCPPPT